MSLTHRWIAEDRASVGVVGAGVAGIVAAYLLEKRGFAVTLFEKGESLGGHTNTFVVPYGPDRGVAIDTGFIVLNDRTYPTLHRFLERLGIEVVPTEMSFSYWDPIRHFGYAGTSLRGLFAQPKNLFNRSFYGLLWEMRRFSIEASEAYERGDLEGLDVGEFLLQRGFSKDFQNDYLLPMGAAIWSTSTENMMQYPAASLVGFFKNHGLLSIKDRPNWQTIPGGARRYVENFEKGFRGRIFKNAKIRSIRESEDRALLKHEDGSETEFDVIVMACHADQALALLESPTELQRELLGPWEYQENHAFLHQDERAMPPNRKLWACWNFLDSESDSVFVSYYMNRLQPLKTENPYFVTLNPQVEIAPEKIVYETRYTHPRYTLSSVGTQARLPDLNLNCRILFCGSYFGHGFHEDAAKAGAAIGALVGSEL